MRVLTASEMAAVDSRAIEELGIPGMVLMENAAVGVADALAEYFPTANSVVVLCGPGNNGGDGLALARHLEARGYRHRTVLVTGRSQPRGDAGTQLEILERCGFVVERLGPGDDLGHVVAACARADVVVDALFGTGLSRPLEGHFAELVESVDGLGVPILAVDVPSGVDGSRAEPSGSHLRATLTVTFAAPKVAHVLPPAALAAGRLVVTDLGIPPWLVEEAPGQLHLSSGGELAACLLPRERGDHKGSLGHALVVAGATGMAGAAILCTRGALRGGAGLVTLAAPGSLAGAVHGASPESMVLSLAEEPSGLSPENEEALMTASEGKTAVALGPGLGRGQGTGELVRHFVKRLDLPLVLDADGLWPFSGRLEELAERSAPTMLTPHPGEMGRLLACSTVEVQEDRLGAVRRAAQVAQATVVLKGDRTLVADPEGTVVINPTGNPGLATGGSGDVLTGLLAALLARGYEPFLAAQLGVYLHGLAGDLAAEDKGWEGLLAGDVAEALPQAFLRLEGA